MYPLNPSAPLHRQRTSQTTMTFGNKKIVIDKLYIDRIDPHSPVKDRVINSKLANRTISFDGFTEEDQKEFLDIVRLEDQRLRDIRLNEFGKKHSFGSMHV